MVIMISFQVNSGAPIPMLQVTCSRQVNQNPTSNNKWCQHHVLSSTQTNTSKANVEVPQLQRFLGPPGSKKEQEIQENKPGTEPDNLHSPETNSQSLWK